MLLVDAQSAQRVAAADTVLRSLTAKPVATFPASPTAPDPKKSVPFWMYAAAIVAQDQTPEQAPSNHSPLFYVDESGLGLGVRALANVAVDYLNAK